jgi:hypothetical protein
MSTRVDAAGRFVSSAVRPRVGAQARLVRAQRELASARREVAAARPAAVAAEREIAEVQAGRTERRELHCGDYGAT